jgi:hypothetical protein
LIERFLYPKLGPGLMWESIASDLQGRGVRIERETVATRVEHRDGRISAVCADGPGGERKFEADAVVSTMPVRDLVREELERGAADDAFPMAPARIVADVRAAMGREDIVLADTGAVKMWMARLYPTYHPDTCLISNGLATMAFSLPGAIAAKMAFPERKVLAAMGDGAFAMSMAEIETAVRERVPITILVWVDGGYGLIGWKQDIHFGRQAAVAFTNPDFVMLAESFGAKGYAIETADQLAPALAKALGDDAVSIREIPDREPRGELVSKARTERGLLSDIPKGGSAHFAVRVTMKENKARIGPVIVRVDRADGVQLVHDGRIDFPRFGEVGAGNRPVGVVPHRVDGRQFLEGFLRGRWLAWQTARE